MADIVYRRENADQRDMAGCFRKGLRQCHRRDGETRDEPYLPFVRCCCVRGFNWSNHGSHLDRTFTPALAPELASSNPTDDLERDQVLTQRIRLFGWVTEKHLDLPCDPQVQENGEGLASATSSSANSTSVLADSANLPVRASGSKSAIKMSPSGKSRRKDGKSRQDYLDDAQREILRINQFRAPRDKLITILNCCIIIFSEPGISVFVP